jgi:3-methylcrotonyl-CoA carboxylase alpha subunit
MSIKLALDGRIHDVTIARRRPHLVLLIDGEEHEISELPELGDGSKSMSIGGHHIDFARAVLGHRQAVRLGGRTFEIGYVDPFSESTAAGSGQDVLKAPMPGAVVFVHKQIGDIVTRGEPVVTIESMKLQTALPSPRDGVVANVLRLEGQTFEKDEIIVTLESESEKA